MGLLHRVHTPHLSFPSGLIHGILQILRYRLIGGNLNNIHAIDITELLLLCQAPYRSYRFSQGIY